MIVFSYAEISLLSVTNVCLEAIERQLRSKGTKGQKLAWFSSRFFPVNSTHVFELFAPCFIENERKTSLS